MSQVNFSRRRFLKGSAALGGLTILPSGIYAQQGKRVSPNGKLQLACIGVGGRGMAAVSACQQEKIVALCDVDAKMAKKAYSQNPKAKQFVDYRELFAEMGDQIDGVTISGPDHVHFVHAMAAVKAGKHVYVEKPLCQTIHQTRALHAAATAAGVKTQMGNQGHSQHAIRDFKELVQAGAMGEVKEMWAWTNRPAGMWPQGRTALPKAEEVPSGLDWDLWRNGVAAEFSSDYVPFKWRGWTMWGTGSLGDMACHILDPVFYAFDLGMPDWVEGEVVGGSQWSYPERSTVKMHFPTREGRPEFVLTWYEGKGNEPPRPELLESGREMGSGGGGTITVGSRNVAMSNSHANMVEIIPQVRHQELVANGPEVSLRRVKGQDHFGDWFSAVRGEVEQASSHFDHAAKLNELVLLGTIAQRLPGERLQWDEAAGHFKNNEMANRLVKTAVI